MTLPAMLPSLPLLTEEDVYLFQNSKTAQKLIPSVFNTFMDLLFDKRDEESFVDYLRRIKIKKIEKKYEDKQSKKVKANSQPTTELNPWETYMKIWKLEKTKLNNTNGKDLDTTFLFKFFLEIFEDLDRPWLTGDKEKIKKILKEMKDIRNSVAHEPTGGAIAPDVMKKSVELANELYNIISQNNYSIDKGLIDQAKIEVRKMAEDIPNLSLTERENIMFQIRKHIQTTDRENTRQKWQSTPHKISLFGGAYSFNLNDVFHSTNLITKAEDNVKNELSCENLLDYSDQKVLLITGESGSGKTTLLQQICSDAYSDHPEVIKGVRNYENVLLFKCREHKYEDIKDYLMNIFSELAKKVEERDILNAIENISTLVLIDGIDEWNTYSRRIVEQLVELVNKSNSIKCVVTTRPHMEKTFVELLNKRNIEIGRAHV
jgi:chromosomal replication initiation ATPase DnaA